MTQQPFDRLDALAAQIAQEQDAVRQNRSIEEQETRLSAFLDAAQAAQPAPAGRWVFLRLAAIPAAAALLIAAVVLFRPSPPGFSLDGADGKVGRTIRVDGRRTALAEFTDASQIWINGGTVAAVTAVDDRGATVRMDTGSAYVKVRHKETTRWRIDAGPFTVNVTGTAFLLSWNRDRQVFDIQMDEGRVMVSGPTLSPARSVSGGQRLTVRLDDPGPDAAAAAEEAGAPPAAVENAPGNGNRQGDGSRGHRVPPSPATEKSPPADDWISLAARRLYRESFAAAEKEGFDNLCNRIDGALLLRLADVSRFAGNGPGEVRALQCVRRRFAGSTHSATAAYMLGHAAFRSRQFRDAEKWNLIYLKETPDGPLAEPALGRVMEIQHQQGRMQMARSTAGEYLRRFPDGAGADLARELVR